MDLEQALQNLKFDTRMKDWMQKQGIASKEDLEKHLGTLPDAQADCEPVTLEDRPDFAD